MSASVTVRYYTHEDKSGKQGYTLRCVAINAVDMPKEIFVFQRRVDSAMNSGDPTTDDTFVKVAEPNALEEFPVTPPNPVAENPYFRQDNVTLVFRSYTELEETKGLIEDCIRGLVVALKASENLADMDEVTYD